MINSKVSKQLHEWHSLVQVPWKFGWSKKMNAVLGTICGFLFWIWDDVRWVNLIFLGRKNYIDPIPSKKTMRLSPKVPEKSPRRTSPFFWTVKPSQSTILKLVFTVFYPWKNWEVQQCSTWWPIWYDLVQADGQHPPSLDHMGADTETPRGPHSVDFPAQLRLNPAQNPLVTL